MNNKPEVSFVIDTSNFIALGVGAIIFPIDHPSDKVSNKEFALTSEVISIDGDNFETMNTKYVGVNLQ